MVFRRLREQRENRKQEISRLLEKSREVAKEVLSESIVDEVKELIFSDRIELAKGHQWDASHRLMEARIVVDEQIAVLHECFGTVSDAKRLQIGGHELREFLNYFSESLSKEVNDLGSLTNGLKKRQDEWLALVERISIRKMRVSVSHVVLRVSERSGLELSSIMVAGLVLPGMTYVWFYYQAAAGQLVHRYWILDDLIVQGINAIWLSLSVLLCFEVGIRFLQRGFETETGFASRSSVVTEDPDEGSSVAGDASKQEEGFSGQMAWRSRIFVRILKRPSEFLLLFIASFVFAASVVGYLNGDEAFDEFVAASKQGEAGLEVATVSDGTILRGVYLVGTTSTTAVFLQVADGRGHSFNSAPGYFQILGNIFLLFPWPGTLGETTENNANGKYQVVVMDRAHILCHSRGATCAVLLESRTDAS